MAAGSGILKVACPQCGQRLDVTELAPFARIDCPSCGGEVIAPKPFANLMLEEPVGSGGMAAVYRALDLTLDREVAVKILKPEFAASAGAGQVFLNEARSAAVVNHVNVIPIYSCGNEEGEPYLVMQFMAGGSLAGVVSPGEGVADVPFALRAVAAAARGLGAAFRHGIVHHDVKPANIMLDADGNVKIGDFGLSAVVREDAVPALESVLRGWGSPAYVSPERLRGGREDWRGDVFSLGATLYVMVTGRPALVGEGMRERLSNRASGVYPAPPVELRPELPEELSDFVMRLMAFDADDRPGDHAAISDRLEKLARTWGAARRGGGRGIPMNTANREALLRVQERQLQQGAAGSRSGRIINVCLAVAIAVLVVLVALMVHRRLAGAVTVPRSADSGAVTRPLPRTEARAPAPAAAGPLHAVLSDRPGWWSRRPRPPGLDFASCEEELRGHLASLPEPVREQERERLSLIVNTRDYLVTLMARGIPADRGPDRLVLASGEVLRGAIQCHAAGLVVRVDEGGSRNVAWQEVTSGQFAELLGCFARLRQDLADRRQAVDDWVRIALLCDWYGDPGGACEALDAALAVQPGVATRVERLLPWYRLEPVVSSAGGG